MTAVTRGRWRAPRRGGSRELPNVSGVLGLVLTVLSLGVAFLGPAFAPYAPSDLFVPREPSSGAHLLGTDQVGHDVWSRVLNGGLEVVTVPVIAVAIAFTLGAFVGMWSALAGGWADTVATRLVDVLIALPPLLLAIVFIASLGHSPVVLVSVTAVFFIPRIVRVVRGATASIVTSDYVAAARLRGDSTIEIIWREVTPNVSGVLIVEFAARLSNVVMFVATLNFLGLGAQPGSSSWGLLVSEMRLLLHANPLDPLVPALLIAALAVGVNLLADELAAHLARDQKRANAR